MMLGFGCSLMDFTVAAEDDGSAKTQETKKTKKKKKNRNKKALTVNQAKKIRSNIDKLIDEYIRLKEGSGTSVESKESSNDEKNTEEKTVKKKKKKKNKKKNKKK